MTNRSYGISNPYNKPQVSDLVPDDQKIANLVEENMKLERELLHAKMVRDVLRTQRTDNLFYGLLMGIVTGYVGTIIVRLMFS